MSNYISIEITDISNNDISNNISNNDISNSDISNNFHCVKSEVKKMARKMSVFKKFQQFIIKKDIHSKKIGFEK